MKRLTTILMAAAIATSLATASEPGSTDVFAYWRTLDGVATQSTFRHIREIAQTDFQRRDSIVAGLSTRGQWEAYVGRNREKLTQLVGTFPKKCRLNAVTVGTAEEDGIVAEKLYFESMPGYKVSAVVFRPKKRSGRMPAVLYCCGHIPNGFRYEAYQKLMLNLVKKGFIVMTFDPIGQGERHMAKFEAATHEHSYAGAQAFALGFSPALYFINDGIRAIDYLQSRPDVDPARIGVTGRSGGGTQAAYIGAFDERVAAVATENYITDLQHLLMSKGAQDAEQNFIHAIAEGFDNSDLLTLRAPRPTLIVATYNDIFAIQGTKNAFSEAARAFKALGNEDNLSITYDYGGHTSTRKNNQAIYAFFSKHLKNPCSTEDEEVKYFKEQELTLFPGKNFFEATAGKTMFQVNREMGDAVKAERNSMQSADYQDFLSGLPETVRQITGLDRHP
ncbi:MAG: acetylxylan esterase [Muribaculaceae bacterium]|nr:acetylxylan esterase [Muribaculaceae bacterium]